MKKIIFITETDEKYIKAQSKKSLIIVFLAFSLVACLGFLVAWKTFVFFEAIVIVSCVAVLFQKRNESHSWRLEFIDNTIKITNMNTKEEFTVCDISASDFVINQSKNEKKIDYCSLMIKNTIFLFGGIKNCQQLKAYIKENF